MRAQYATGAVQPIHACAICDRCSAAQAWCSASLRDDPHIPVALMVLPAMPAALQVREAAPDGPSPPGPGLPQPVRASTAEFTGYTDIVKAPHMRLQTPPR